MRRPRLATVMTPFPYSVESQQPLRDAEAMLDEHGFHHLPVTRDGELAGVLSRTLLRLARAEGADEDAAIEGRYQADPYVVDINDPLDEVVLQMAERGAESVLVQRKGKLVGILTHSDVALALGELLRDLGPEEPPDAIG